MSPVTSRAVELGERTLARAAFTYLAEPGDPALGALLGICEPEEILAAIKADMLPGTGPGCGDQEAPERRTNRPPDVVGETSESNGLGELTTRDQFGLDRLPGRRVHGRAQPQGEGEGQQ